jgi:hypothetical protein
MTTTRPSTEKSFSTLRAALASEEAMAVGVIWNILGVSRCAARTGNVEIW